MVLLFIRTPTLKVSLLNNKNENNFHVMWDVIANNTVTIVSGVVGIVAGIIGHRQATLKNKADAIS